MPGARSSTSSHSTHMFLMCVLYLVLQPWCQAIHVITQYTYVICSYIMFLSCVPALVPGHLRHHTVHICSYIVSYLPHHTIMHICSDLVFQPWCQAIHVITQYFVTCNFFWMFCEGFYLHTIIVVAFSTGKKLLIGCYFLGWGRFILTTSLWDGVGCWCPHYGTG